MWYATTTRIAASVASGMSAAHRPKKSVMSEQRQRVHHAGDRRPAAVLDVGRRARDRAGGGNAAEQRRHDVGDALRHQLHVRPMPPPIMPSATTADSSDSTAPSSAMVNAGPTSDVHLRERHVRHDGLRQRPRDRAEARCRSSRPADEAAATTTVATMQRDERPGNALADLRPERR